METSNIVLLCPILSRLLIMRPIIFNEWGSSWIAKMMQPDKLAPMFSSLLYESIGITWEKLTLKARLTMNFPKHLRWKIYRMKTGGALLNTGLTRSIRYIIYMWSYHMLKSYLRMCNTNLSSCRWTVQRTRPTVRKWNSNRRQDLVAILHTARLL